MGRPRGTHNPDYESNRKELLRSLDAHLTSGGAHASFRELAEAVGVSVSTLRHYFGTRERLVETVLAEANASALRYLHAVATGPLPDVADSLSWYLTYLVDGLSNHSALGLHEVGLINGIGQPALGPAYLNEVLEPTLQALEARLARHMAAGQLRTGDTRVAALALVGPVLLALLHQKSLGGRACRPMDIKAMVQTHLSSWLGGHLPLNRPAVS
jgi:AcrR family transcriptional regulator